MKSHYTTPRYGFTESRRFDECLAYHLINCAVLKTKQTLLNLKRHLYSSALFESETSKEVKDRGINSVSICSHVLFYAIILA